MDDFAIKIDNVSKEFKLPHEKTSSIKSMAINFYKRNKGYEIQKALHNVSFEVKKGEFFGIVGRNGSGKSTLLKLLAGIYAPTKGQVHVRGTLTPFIELGVGFNMELTGRENVYLNGALLGFSRKDMQEMYKEIVKFAELEKFMDQKLKNYSSGMQVRLAFSIAIRAHSDIVVLDEVLAVGDAAFQEKCFDVFRDLKKDKRTIVLVTHDMSNVERFCDRALVLDSGEILDITSPQNASRIYARLNMEREHAHSESKEKSSNQRWGSGGIKVKRVSVSQDGADKKAIFETGKNLKIDIELDRAKGFTSTPVVCGLAFYNKDGVNLAGPNSRNQSIKTNANKIYFNLDKLNFAPGNYSLTVALYDEEIITAYDFLDRYINFSIVSGHTVHGLVEVEGTWGSD
jgi:ABC-2 type transport system ATP-binding protein